jgi:hypothetical protein
VKMVEAWQCDFCNKTSAFKAALANHERACKNNPERRHCITCIHGVEIPMAEVFKPLTIQSYMPDFDNTPDVYAGPWCDFHKMPIREKPYFVDCDWHDVPHDEGWPEPWTCEHYEYKGHAGWDRREAEASE